MNARYLRRIVAREWLTLLACVLVAVALMVTVMITDQEDFYLEVVLFGGIFLYGLFFLERSIVWAVRTIRQG